MERHLKLKDNDKVNDLLYTFKHFWSYMEAWAYGFKHLRFINEKKKMFCNWINITLIKWYFFVNTFILTLINYCLSHCFSILILTHVHCKTTKWEMKEPCMKIYIDVVIQITKKNKNMSAWKHYCGALEAMWHYKEMWSYVIFENEGEKDEDDEGSDDGEKEVVVK